MPSKSDRQTRKQILVCRSDGEAVVALGLPNEPTAVQQDQGRQYYYRKTAADSDQRMNWMAALGDMYTKVLPNNPQAELYVLSELPEGYVLWEQVQPRAGETPRTDLYLYGHPTGKKFRSTKEFFPHLLWLLFDMSGNAETNCSCVLCFPVPGLSPEERLRDARVVAAEKMGVSNSSALLPEEIALTSKEQLADADPESLFLYRSGEIVWFDRYDDASNWRLAVISKRRMLENTPQYLLQPLSNPFEQQRIEIKTQPSLRPWLAWSVPNTTIQQLNNMLFDDVPWNSVQNGELGHADYVVDGSILAAKQIDASYTLFNKLGAPVDGLTRYQGMFLGSEKVWVGEPVRLRNAEKTVISVIVVSELVENAENGNFTFVGNVYQLEETDTKSEPRPELPPRMLTDIRYRNNMAERGTTGIFYKWNLMQIAATKTLADVSGRWYETRTMLPVLKTTDVFRTDLMKGITSDTGQWMNSRKHLSTLPDERRKNRKQTLGKSVPDYFKVSKGLDGPAEDDAFPA